MVMVAADLAEELEALTPTSDVSSAIAALADAWEAYFVAATVGPTQVATGTLAAAKAAMVTALAGINTPSGGATAIQAGIVAWWGVVIPAAAVIWAGNAPPVLSATPPPSLSTIAAVLAPVFASNTGGSLTLQASTTAIAAALHPLNLGAIAAVGPPAGTVPIL